MGTDRHHPAAERVGVARFDEEARRRACVFWSV
jgi:hypothetical protein